MLIYPEMIDSPAEKTKLETMYRAYRGLMYKIAYDILQNEQDAEDAVHHAFLKLAKNMQKIGEPVCPKTKGYIVTVIESAAIDLYRKKKRHPTVPFTEETVGLQVEYTGSNGLAKCLSLLPARYRQVLILRYHYGYDAKEIGKLLGISAANVRKLLQRGKSKLEILCKEAEIL